MALSAAYYVADTADHEADLQARGDKHPAFALTTNATILLIKQATEAHVVWTVDPADESLYRFDVGFQLLMLLCPCEVIHDSASLAQKLTTGSTKLHVLVDHVALCFQAGMPSTSTVCADSWWSRLITWTKKLKDDPRMRTLPADIYEHQTDPNRHSQGFVDHGTNADCTDGDGVPVSKPYFYYYVGAHYLYAQRKAGTSFFKCAGLVRGVSASAVPTVAMMMEDPNDGSAMSGLLQWLADSHRPELLCSAAVTDAQAPRIMDLNHRLMWSSGGKDGDRLAVLQKSFGRLLKSGDYSALQKTLGGSEAQEAFEQYLRLVRERKSHLDPMALSTLKVVQEMLVLEVHIFDHDKNKSLVSAHDRVSLLVKNKEDADRALQSAKKGSALTSEPVSASSGSSGGYTKDEIGAIMVECQSIAFCDHAARVLACANAVIVDPVTNLTTPDPLAELKAIREILAVPLLNRDALGALHTPNSHVLLMQCLLHNRKLTKTHHEVFQVITDLQDSLELYFSQFTIFGYYLGEGATPNAKLRQLIIPGLFSALRDEGWHRVDWINDVALVIKGVKNFTEYPQVLLEYPMADLRYLTEVEGYLCNSLEALGIQPTGKDSPAALLAQCRSMVSDTDHLKGDLHADMQASIGEIFVEGLRCGFRQWKKTAHNRRADVILERVLLPGAAILFRALIVDVQAATASHRNLVSVMPSLRKFFDADGSRSTNPSLQSLGHYPPHSCTKLV